MTPKNPITRNIILTMTVYLIAQLVFLTVLALVFGISGRFTLLFAAIAVAFHIALTVFLVWMRDDFSLADTGEKLRHVNGANLLTLTRLSLLPVISYLLIASREYPVVPVLLAVTVVAFLTDLFDGALSRRTHQITAIGKLLDSISDYSVLIVISIAFFVFRLLPDWFFTLVIVRFGAQALAVTLLLFGFGIRAESNPLGKVAVFTTMTLYAFEIMKLIGAPVLGNEQFVAVLEYIVAAVLVISLFDKVVLLMRTVTNRSEPSAPDRDTPHQDT
mgnify:CR=1 FL=1|jgi:cardiolipin synthase